MPRKNPEKIKPRRPSKKCRRRQRKAIAQGRVLNPHARDVRALEAKRANPR